MVRTNGKKEEIDQRVLYRRTVHAIGKKKGKRRFWIRSQSAKRIAIVVEALAWLAWRKIPHTRIIAHQNYPILTMTSQRQYGISMQDQTKERNYWIVLVLVPTFHFPSRRLQGFIPLLGRQKPHSFSGTMSYASTFRRRRRPRPSFFPFLEMA